MPTLKLTQIAVDKITSPKTGRVEYFDAHLPGFGLRVADSGHKTWVVFYRIARKQRRFTIGTLAAYPKVDQARERARELLRDVGRGIDPAIVKAEQPSRGSDDVRQLVAQYIERYAKPKNRSWQETNRTLQRHVVSRWGGRDSASIGRRDVIELLDELVDRGNPIAANRVLAAIRRLFSWGVEREILTASPVVNIKAPSAERERDRVLSDEEITRLWKAAEVMGGVPGAFLQTLILTAQRREEVASMRWADLDLAGRVWALPREATKGDRSHEVPLSPYAIRVVTALPRTGPYVFSSNRGDRHISGYSKIKARAQSLSQIEEDWRLHDLRRSAGTGMARLGIAVSTISRILNHKEGGVTRIYNRYSLSRRKTEGLGCLGEQNRNFGSKIADVGHLSHRRCEDATGLIKL